MSTDCPALRKPYPTDVSDEEWALVAPYLTLVAGRRVAAALSAARSLQCRPLDGAGRRAVAVAADQLPTLAHRLPADAPLAGGRLLRGARPRPAAAGASGGRTEASPRR